MIIYHFLHSEILRYETSPNNQEVCPNDFLHCLFLSFPFIFMLVQLITILHENTIIFTLRKIFYFFHENMLYFTSEIKTSFCFCFFPFDFFQVNLKIISRFEFR